MVDLLFFLFYGFGVLQSIQMFLFDHRITSVQAFRAHCVVKRNGLDLNASCANVKRQTSLSPRSLCHYQAGPFNHAQSKYMWFVCLFRCFSSHHGFWLLFWSERNDFGLCWIAHLSLSYVCLGCLCVLCYSAIPVTSPTYHMAYLMARFCSFSA